MAENGTDPTAAVFPDLSNPNKGFGKLILFGEHFVVYNAPALVGAVSAATTCTAKVDTTGNDTGLTVIDDRPAIPGYKEEKKDEADVALNLVLKHFDLDPSKVGINLHFGGTLCAVSGIGASAAQVVAQSRALNAVLGKNMSEDEINAAGYEGERGYHGTPSGIDNTAATFGGVLRFQRKTDGPPIFVKKKLAQVRVVVVEGTYLHCLFFFFPGIPFTVLIPHVLCTARLMSNINSQSESFTPLPELPPRRQPSWVTYDRKRKPIRHGSIISSRDILI